MLSVDPQWAACDACNCVDGVSPLPRWGVKGMIEPDRVCPRRRLEARHWHLVDLYRHYAAGHLLYAGGVDDQPAYYLDAMLAIEAGVRIGESG